MTYPQRYRRSIRLAGYDYSRSGAYFVSICTRNRECLFGVLVDAGMQLNGAGSIVQTAWDDLPSHYPHLELDAFVIMPNHIHGIVVLADFAFRRIEAGFKAAPTTPAPTMPIVPSKRHALPEIVRAFKTFSARRINVLRNSPGVPVWQRNYYEHIIRDEESLNRVREYIANNPARWVEDPENPDVEGPRSESNPTGSARGL
jgi:REP element-mobilizing transposase RayT